LAAEPATPDPVQEAIALLESRKAQARSAADQARLAEAVVALRRFLPDAGPAPVEVSADLVRRKFAGKASFSPKVNELTIVYDFGDKGQLKDFEVGKVKPSVENNLLKVEGGAGVRHAVPFRSVKVSGTVAISNLRGGHLRTTQGFGFACDGSHATYAKLQLLDAGKPVTDQRVTPKEYQGKFTPFEFTAGDGRVGLKFGAAALGKTTTVKDAGQVEFLGGEGLNAFGKLTLSGTVDPEWLRKFVGP
jgi:hypothetical protein